MTTFSEQMATDLAALYDTDEFASSAVHATVAGVETSVTVILFEGSGPVQDGADAYGVNAQLRVRVSELVTVAAGETFTIGSDTWEVVGAEKSVDGLEWLADISKRS